MMFASLMADKDSDELSPLRKNRFQSLNDIPDIQEKDDVTGFYKLIDNSNEDVQQPQVN